jgi:hypothetical protein
MTRCNGQPVAKISDEPSKAMDYDPSYVKVPARGVPGAGGTGGGRTREGLGHGAPPASNALAPPASADAYLLAGALPGGTNRVVQSSDSNQ